MIPPFLVQLYYVILTLQLDQFGGGQVNRTMAHIACINNNLEILEFIYNCGYSINTPDRFGNTPLDEAKRSNAQDCVTFLDNHINCENLI